MAGCIAYAGKGFSEGVLHMLRPPRTPHTACRQAARPTPPEKPENWITCLRRISVGGMFSSAHENQ